MATPASNAVNPAAAMAERPAAYHQQQQLHHSNQEPSRAEVDARMMQFWDQELRSIEAMPADLSAFKNAELPLARIKKIMKLDDDVKGMMIAAEAPLLFSKAAEIFIREVTVRAWAHTERSRRRTLQRNDIATSVGDPDTDQFDFLIDIVPREVQPPPQQQPQQFQQPQQHQPTQPQHHQQSPDPVAGGNNKPTAVELSTAAAAAAASVGVVAGTPATAAPPVQYVIQLPVGSGGIVQQQTAAPTAALVGNGQPLQIIINSAAPPPLPLPPPAQPAEAIIDVKPNLAIVTAAAPASVAMPTDGGSIVRGGP